MDVVQEVAEKETYDRPWQIAQQHSAYETYGLTQATHEPVYPMERMSERVWEYVTSTLYNSDAYGNAKECQTAMIEIIASSVNYVIAFLALVCLVIAVYLYYRSRTIPGKMDKTIRTTAAKWNLAGAQETAVMPARVLEGMKVFVETAGPTTRAELRGYLKGTEESKELDLSSVRAIQRLAKVLTEVFPLLGILGTVCALSVAVGLSGGGEPPTSDLIGQFLGLFGQAVDSTIYGLLAAVIFMVVFAAIEGRLERSYELVDRYRDVMDRALLLAYSREEDGGQDNA